MRRTPTAILPLLLAACATPAPETPAAPAPTAEAAGASEPPEPPAKVAPVDIDGPDGIRRWGQWEGPKDGPAVSGKKAWVIAPRAAQAGGKLSFSNVGLGLVDVEKAGGAEVVFSIQKQRFAVPAALAWPAEAAKGIKKGDPVLCALGGEVVIARAEAASAKAVTCAFRREEKTRRERVPATEVRRLDGKTEPGAPAIVRFESDRASSYLGTVLLARGGEVWVQVAGAGESDARAVRQVKAANVEVIDAARPLKVGDACLATDLAGVTPCKVTKVIDGGLSCVVDFEGGSAGSKGEWAIGEIAPAGKR